jgi:hypothetical protein
LYVPPYRFEWLAKITEAAVHRRAEIYYQQIGRIAVVARAGTTRPVGRRPKTQRDEIAAPDSFDRMGVDTTARWIGGSEKLTESRFIPWAGRQDHFLCALPSQGRYFSWHPFL